jgi:hypothetical protein
MVFPLSGYEFVATGIIIIRKEVCISNPLSQVRTLRIDSYLSISA